MLCADDSFSPMILHCLHTCTQTQVAMLVSQSVILGYLSDYFSVEDPTADETRDAYLYAAGGWQGLPGCGCVVMSQY